MLRTYKARLRGDRLEWVDAPDESSLAGDVAVFVTILDELPAAMDASAQGKRMVELLSQMAQQHTFADIQDPAAWERQLRAERELPDRAA